MYFQRETSVLDALPAKNGQSNCNTYESYKIRILNFRVVILSLGVKVNITRLS